MCQMIISFGFKCSIDTYTLEMEYLQSISGVPSKYQIPQSQVVKFINSRDAKIMSFVAILLFLSSSVPLICTNQVQLFITSCIIRFHKPASQSALIMTATG